MRPQGGNLLSKLNNLAQSGYLEADLIKSSISVIARRNFNIREPAVQIAAANQTALIDWKPMHAIEGARDAQRVHNPAEQALYLSLIGQRAHLLKHPIPPLAIAIMKCRNISSRSNKWAA
jgi:hypothetical protein